MPKSISDEINKYISLIPSTKTTTLQKLNKARQQTEKDITNKFKGTLMRGTIVPDAHYLFGITFTRYYDGDVSIYNLTNDKSGWLSFGAFDNMKRISEVDLSPQEKGVYDNFNKRMKNKN